MDIRTKLIVLELTDNHAHAINSLVTCLPPLMIQRQQQWHQPNGDHGQLGLNVPKNVTEGIKIAGNNRKIK